MRVANFEATGLEKLEAWIERNNYNDINEQTLKQVLQTINISFVLEEIDRVQSTLICELKDSYVQQSQRYVTMSGGAYILPELDYDDGQKAVKLTEKAFDLYCRMSKLKEGDFSGRPKVQHYLHGIPIEDARYILPLSTKTNVCVAMSGDKLLELFRLINDKKYAAIFTELYKEMMSNLPAGLVSLLHRDNHGGVRQDLVKDFYVGYFSKINTENNLVLLECFSNQDMKVGFGALTSTLKEAPSQVINKWGQDAPVKAKGVVERVLGYGHESIAEQARTTFGMMCSMVTYHQQLRHRLSQNFREELSILLQDKDRLPKVPETIKNSVFYQEFRALVDEFKTFRLFIATKYGQDKALSFLLNCDQIKLIISSNARADISMLSDRTCMNAQWEIRELAIKKLMLLRTLSDILYEKALPSCVLGKCREGKLSCGQQAKVIAQFDMILSPCNN
ncbi:MAG: FAD-dependent thymidylate synthase [Firmicutes bacterium]|nr:FAD-dependent thymidylate synthase [Bacillota bacterium]